ncbi:SMP-30/gluconolactonase/LRE family protein [Caballeronia sp. ATUFL_M2_KS44]|uniref:SMP-30/gluconolactonase/LRE family protein n=1 Tax=Caballeronia sp. ATUFL_M2_KS44 TaxID=2921767 RepID=UPI002027C12A|nr:SMP-30/gluconolactonase/LRE family protein [Caballeronia sp. ATUFL_M2_KS44]
MTSTPRVERIEAAGRAAVGECPVWHAKDRALYWVDIPARRIVRLRTESGQRSEWTLPEQVACFAFDAAGTIVAGMESGLFAVTLQDAGDVRLTKLAAPRFGASEMRFNDGRCDRQGRFWAGTMVQDMAQASTAGALYRFDADGTLSAPIVDGLITQNGLAFSPDGATLYLSDSHPQRRLIWAFDLDTDTGVPHDRRVFVDLNHHVGRPDGAAVDADGCYWTCANDAGCLLRFTPEGKLDRTVAVPAIKPSMCAFGGDDLSTLYVTSIRPASNATDDDGCVFALRPGVQGLPEPGYAGMLPVA